MTDGGSPFPPPDGGTPGEVPSTKKKPWWRRWWAIGAVVIVLAIIGAIVGSPDNDEDDVATASTSTAATPREPLNTEASVESTAATAPTDPPETTVPPTDPPTTPETTAPSTTLPEPLVISGAGDSVATITIPGGGSIGIATIGHSGSSNFSIWALDANLEQLDLLVNEIGAYQGTVLLPEGTTALEIGADGAWQVEVKPMQAARAWQDTVSGRGDDVLLYLGDTGIAAITHSGNSNFSVWTYPQNGSTDLLVNEIGPYTGSVRFPGPAFIEVGADGDWTITVA